LGLKFESAEVQTLMNLGLNNSQAKIYFTLAQFGPSNVTEIAKQVQCDPPDTYCTLVKLCQLGIVERIVRNQTKFKAASADQTLKFLLKRKTCSTPKKPFLPNLNSGDEKGSGFVLIPHKDQIIKHAVNAVNNAKVSLDFVISWNFFSEFVYAAFPEKINPTVPKRCVIEQPAKIRGLNITKKLKNDSFQFRFIQSKPKAMLAIFDNKDLIMIEDLVDGDAPGLFTSNQNMLIMAKNYFDNLWRESTIKPV